MSKNLDSENVNLSAIGSEAGSIEKSEKKSKKSDKSDKKKSTRIGEDNNIYKSNDLDNYSQNIGGGTDSQDISKSKKKSTKSDKSIDMSMKSEAEDLSSKKKKKSTKVNTSELNDNLNNQKLNQESISPTASIQSGKSNKSVMITSNQSERKIQSQVTINPAPQITKTGSFVPSLSGSVAGDQVQQEVVTIGPDGKQIISFTSDTNITGIPLSGAPIQRQGTRFNHEKDSRGQSQVTIQDPEPLPQVKKSGSFVPSLSGDDQQEVVAIGPDGEQIISFTSDTNTTGVPRLGAPIQRQGTQFIKDFIEDHDEDDEDGNGGNTRQTQGGGGNGPSRANESQKSDSRFDVTVGDLKNPSTYNSKVSQTESDIGQSSSMVDGGDQRGSSNNYGAQQTGTQNPNQRPSSQQQQQQYANGSNDVNSSQNYNDNNSSQNLNINQSQSKGNSNRSNSPPAVHHAKTPFYRRPTSPMHGNIVGGIKTYERSKMNPIYEKVLNFGMKGVNQNQLGSYGTGRLNLMAGGVGGEFEEIGNDGTMEDIVRQKMIGKKDQQNLTNRNYNGTKQTGTRNSDQQRRYVDEFGNVILENLQDEDLEYNVDDNGNELIDDDIDNDTDGGGDHGHKRNKSYNNGQNGINQKRTNVYGLDTLRYEGDQCFFSPNMETYRERIMRDCSAERKYLDQGKKVPAALLKRKQDKINLLEENATILKHSVTSDMFNNKYNNVEDKSKSTNTGSTKGGKNKTRSRTSGNTNRNSKISKEILQLKKRGIKRSNHLYKTGLEKVFAKQDEYIRAQDLGGTYGIALEEERQALKKKKEAEKKKNGNGGGNGGGDDESTGLKLADKSEVWLKRHHALIQAKREKEMQALQLCTFRPEITDLAKECNRKNIAEVNKNFWTQRENRIKDLNSIKDSNYSEQCTFKPHGIGSDKPQEWQEKYQEVKEIGDKVKQYHEIYKGCLDMLMEQNQQQQLGSQTSENITNSQTYTNSRNVSTRVTMSNDVSSDINTSAGQQNHPPNKKKLMQSLSRQFASRQVSGLMVDLDEHLPPENQYNPLGQQRNSNQIQKSINTTVLKINRSKLEHPGLEAFASEEQAAILRQNIAQKLGIKHLQLAPSARYNKIDSMYRSNKPLSAQTNKLYAPIRSEEDKIDAFAPVEQLGCSKRWNDYVRGKSIPGLKTTEIQEVLSCTNCYWTRPTKDDIRMLTPNDIREIIRNGGPGFYEESLDHYHALARRMHLEKERKKNDIRRKLKRSMSAPGSGGSDSDGGPRINDTDSEYNYDDSDLWYQDELTTADVAKDVLLEVALKEWKARCQKGKGGISKHQTEFRMSSVLNNQNTDSYISQLPPNVQKYAKRIKRVEGEIGYDESAKNEIQNMGEDMVMDDDLYNGNDDIAMQNSMLNSNQLTHSEQVESEMKDRMTNLSVLDGMMKQTQSSSSSQTLRSISAPPRKDAGSQLDETMMREATPVNAINEILDTVTVIRDDDLGMSVSETQSNNESKSSLNTAQNGGKNMLYSDKGDAISSSNNSENGESQSYRDNTNADTQIMIDFDGESDGDINKTQASDYRNENSTGSANTRPSRRGSDRSEQSESVSRSLKKSTTIISQPSILTSSQDTNNGNKQFADLQPVSAAEIRSVSEPPVDIMNKAPDAAVLEEATSRAKGSVVAIRRKVSALPDEELLELIKATRAQERDQRPKRYMNTDKMSPQHYFNFHAKNGGINGSKKSMNEEFNRALIAGSQILTTTAVHNQVRSQLEKQLKIDRAKRELELENRVYDKKYKGQDGPSAGQDYGLYANAIATATDQDPEDEKAIKNTGPTQDDIDNNNDRNSNDLQYLRNPISLDYKSHIEGRPQKVAFGTSQVRFKSYEANQCNMSGNWGGYRSDEPWRRDEYPARRQEFMYNIAIGLNSPKWAGTYNFRLAPWEKLARHGIIATHSSWNRMKLAQLRKIEEIHNNAHESRMADLEATYLSELQKIGSRTYIRNELEEERQNSTIKSPGGSRKDSTIRNPAGSRKMTINGTNSVSAGSSSQRISSQKSRKTASNSMIMAAAAAGAGQSQNPNPNLRSAVPTEAGVNFDDASNDVQEIPSNSDMLKQIVDSQGLNYAAAESSESNLDINNNNANNIMASDAANVNSSNASIDPIDSKGAKISNNSSNNKSLSQKNLNLSMIRQSSMSLQSLARNSKKLNKSALNEDEATTVRKSVDQLMKSGGKLGIGAKSLIRKATAELALARKDAWRANKQTGLSSVISYNDSSNNYNKSNNYMGSVTSGASGRKSSFNSGLSMASKQSQMSNLNKQSQKLNPYQVQQLQYTVGSSINNTTELGSGSINSNTELGQLNVTNYNGSLNKDQKMEAQGNQIQNNLNPQGQQQYQSPRAMASLRKSRTEEFADMVEKQIKDKGLPLQVLKEADEHNEMMQKLKGTDEYERQKQLGKIVSMSYQQDYSNIMMYDQSSSLAHPTFIDPFTKKKLGHLSLAATALRYTQENYHSNSVLRTLRPGMKPVNRAPMKYSRYMIRKNQIEREQQEKLKNLGMNSSTHGLQKSVIEGDEIFDIDKHFTYESNFGKSSDKEDGTGRFRHQYTERQLLEYRAIWGPKNERFPFEYLPAHVRHHHYDMSDCISPIPKKRLMEALHIRPKMKLCRSDGYDFTGQEPIKDLKPNGPSKPRNTLCSKTAKFMQLLQLSQKAFSKGMHRGEALKEQILEERKVEHKNKMKRAKQVERQNVIDRNGAKISNNAVKMERRKERMREISSLVEKELDKVSYEIKDLDESIEVMRRLNEDMVKTIDQLEKDNRESNNRDSNSQTQRGSVTASNTGGEEGENDAYGGKTNRASILRARRDSVSRREETISNMVAEKERLIQNHIRLNELKDLSSKELESSDVGGDVKNNSYIPTVMLREAGINLELNNSEGDVETQSLKSGNKSLSSKKSTPGMPRNSFIESKEIYDLLANDISDDEQLEYERTEEEDDLEVELECDKDMVRQEISDGITQKGLHNFGPEDLSEEALKLLVAEKLRQHGNKEPFRPLNRTGIDQFALPDGTAILPDALWRQDGLTQLESTWLPPGWLSPRQMLNVSGTAAKPVPRTNANELISIEDNLFMQNYADPITRRWKYEHFSHFGEGTEKTSGGLSQLTGYWHKFGGINCYRGLKERVRREQEFCIRHPNSTRGKNFMRSVQFLMKDLERMEKIEQAKEKEKQQQLEKEKETEQRAKSMFQMLAEKQVNQSMLVPSIMEVGNYGGNGRDVNSVVTGRKTFINNKQNTKSIRGESSNNSPFNSNINKSKASSYRGAGNSTFTKKSQSDALRQVASETAERKASSLDNNSTTSNDNDTEADTTVAAAGLTVNASRSFQSRSNQTLPPSAMAEEIEQLRGSKVNANDDNDVTEQMLQDINNHNLVGSSNASGSGTNNDLNSEGDIGGDNSKSVNASIQNDIAALTGENQNQDNTNNNDVNKSSTNSLGSLKDLSKISEGNDPESAAAGDINSSKSITKSQRTSTSGTKKSMTNTNRTSQSGSGVNKSITGSKTNKSAKRGSKESDSIGGK